MQNVDVKLSIYPDLQGITRVFTLVFTFEIHGGLRISKVQGQKEVKRALPVLGWGTYQDAWNDVFMVKQFQTLAKFKRTSSCEFFFYQFFLEGMLSRALHHVLSL